MKGLPAGDVLHEPEVDGVHDENEDEGEDGVVDEEVQKEVSVNISQACGLLQKQAETFKEERGDADERVCSLLKVEIRVLARLLR